MTKTFEVTLSVKPRITLHDPEKVAGIVVENKTGWCDCFNSYPRVEDWLDVFSYQIVTESRSFKKFEDGTWGYEKFIEGVGYMVLKEESSNWILRDSEAIEEFGQIEVYLENDGDIEVDWSASEV